MDAGKSTAACQRLGQVGAPVIGAVQGNDAISGC